MQVFSHLFTTQDAKKTASKDKIFRLPINPTNFKKSKMLNMASGHTYQAQRDHLLHAAFLLVKESATIHVGILRYL